MGRVEEGALLMCRRSAVAAAIVVGHFALDAAAVGVLALAATGGDEIPTVQLDPIVAQPPARLNALADKLDGRYDIAAAILLESDRSGIPVDMIAGIMRVENAPLDADTVNWYGATGLMQVWDFHDGAYAAVCGDGGLTDVRTNICYGVEILSEKLQVVGGDTLTALLLYNGCWGVSFDVGCSDYPDKVFAFITEE